MRFGIIGSGSWATALAKILTDNGNAIHWWVRNSDTIQYIQKRKHNPHYLSAAYFNQAQLQLTNDLQELVAAVDVVVDVSGLDPLPQEGSLPVYDPGPAAGLRAVGPRFLVASSRSSFPRGLPPAPGIYIYIPR